MKKPKLIYVKWRDSCGVSSSWEDLKDAGIENDNDSDICICESVGWLIDENKHLIKIFSNITIRRDKIDEEVSGSMTIPKGCIIKRKILKI